MKNLKISAALVLLIATGAFVSCSDDDNASSVAKREALVTTVVGDTIADVNEEIPLVVSFKVDNSCGAFSKFYEAIAANTRTISVEAQYAGTNCDTIPATKTAQYRFKATAAGTYVLKFKKSTTEFVTHNVVVE